MTRTPRPVHDPAYGWRRLVRVVALGGVSYGLAVAAHLAGGGGGPGWPVTLILTGLLSVMSVALTSRRRGAPLVLLVLAGHRHVTAACAPSPAHASAT